MAFSPQTPNETGTSENVQTAPTEKERRQTMLTWLVTAIAVAAFAILRPDTAKTVGVFIVVLSILVFVHEWGHYQFARWAGMKVNRFGIGFPPWIYTKRHNDIDYSIGALPIGGMVDIAGLGSEEEMVAHAKGSEITSPTRAAKPNVPHGQRQFQDASLGWRFWTLFAGPLMNFLFAMLTFVAVFSIAGVPEKFTATNRVEMVQSGMPADKAGIQADDVIIAVNGTRTDDPRKISQLIRAGNGQPVAITINRNGQILQKTMKPVIEELDSLRGTGKEKAPLIGVQFFIRVDSFKKVGLLTSVELGWRNSIGITEQIFGLLKRAVTANLSKEDKRGVGGPVKIAQAIGQSAKRGWQDTAVLMAALSVNLGLLNLLPIPALDGGRILFLGYELLAGRPLDPKKEGLVHMVGMAMLLAFMLFITLRDVMPMIKIG